MTKEDVCKLIVAVRKNWGSPDFDFDRATRSLTGAMVRCSDTSVDELVYATIDELETRQNYRIFKNLSSLSSSVEHQVEAL